MQIYFGIIENRSDPLELGRCQVRVVGLHTHDKNLLPTSDLPWCATMQPTTSAAMNGIGYTPIGPVEGTSVVVTYLDDTMQQGLILGSVGGIATEPVPIDFDDSGPINNTEKSTETVTLRSVAGPTTGNKLKFYDPNSARTDITSVLQANMRVSGYGIDYGTTIVSIDSGTDITISSTVRDFGENLVDFEPPLSNAQSVVESKTNITASTLAEKAEPIKNTPVNGEIPTLPPLPEFKNTQTKASEGIKALIAACDKVGLTTKEQKCALLGIAGGESGWIPKNEGYNYSPERLKQIFSFATDADVEKYANASKKGLTREEFFSWCYGPTKRGKGYFGHTSDAMAGKYYGRGFIQLTGYSNYKKYNDLANKMGLNLNIVDDPDSLDTDINTSALIAALYIKDRTPKGINPNEHPGYFFAAKKAVGVNSPDIAARKLSYYEYFYGKQSTGGVTKDAGAAAPDLTDNPSGITSPGPSNKSISTGSYGVGFRDPNNKYPLKDYIGESDVNRLARGVIDGTVVGLKDAKRALGIPKANGGGTWDQPLAAFGAKYPFNKVMETESGHVQEFDDTPGQERIHTYHRSGTFTEVDANGSQINYIVGDNFILMEQNGCIHVAGECNITVDGNTNIFARTDANIEVAQNATVMVGNNLEIGSASDTTLAVGGDLQIRAMGDISMQGANIYHKTEGSFNTEAASAINMKTAGAMNQEAASDVNVKAGSAIKASGSTVNVKGTGAVNVDYGTYNLGAGAAQAAGSAEAVAEVSLTPPPAGSPLNSTIKYSVPPPREFETKAVIETPEDWDTPEGRAQQNKMDSAEAVAGAAAVIASESAGTLSGGGSAVAVDKTQILTTKDFTNDYRLSKNVVLGMMISGGVGGKHKLTPQMLKAGKDSPERLYTVQEIVGNLAETAANVIEPILDILPGGIGGYNKQWIITSGYRLKGVVPQESPTSDHCKGHCIDVALIHPDINNQTYQMIQKIEKVIPYDQLILEYRYPKAVWMHMSYRKDNNRKMAFTMVNDSVYQRNSKGLPYGFFLIDTIQPKSK
jgi:predicted chitinase